MNIDTNAIQPLTLESIANGTSVNQALSELRCNNTATGRLVTEAFLHALKSNPSLCKLGYPVTDAYFRGEIDKQLTRNNDAARKRRLEEKRRREAEAAEGPASEVPKVAEKAPVKAVKAVEHVSQSKGYPKPEVPKQPEVSETKVEDVKELEAQDKVKDNTTTPLVPEASATPEEPVSSVGEEKLEAGESSEVKEMEPQGEAKEVEPQAEAKEVEPQAEAKEVEPQAETAEADQRKAETAPPPETALPGMVEVIALGQVTLCFCSAYLLPKD